MDTNQSTTPALRLSQQASDAIAAAHSAAIALGHAEVGTQDLLLGIEAIDCPLARDQREHGEPTVAERGDMLATLTHHVRCMVAGTPRALGDAQHTRELEHRPPTKRAQRVLEQAHAVAAALHDESVLPDHILLAIIDDHESIAVQVLAAAGRDHARVVARALERRIARAGAATKQAAT